jgi:hypothetical protein
MERKYSAKVGDAKDPIRPLGQSAINSRSSCDLTTSDFGSAESRSHPSIAEKWAMPPGIRQVMQ